MPVGEVFLGAFLEVLFDRLTPHNLSLFPCEDGIRSELKQWKRKFLMIQAVLDDAEEKQLKSKAVKMWLDDLQDLAYDAEDILDEYATRVLEKELMTEQQRTERSSPITDFFSAWNPSALISKGDGDMKSKIEEITGRLKDLCEERNDLGLKETGGGSSTVVWQRPQSTCVPTEPAVIGRDLDKAMILEMVLSKEPSDDNFHVIPIVAMGGVGKTTLAREIYNDKAVKDFNPKAWVCVSDDFDVLKISKAILESITCSSCSLKNLNEVQVQLKNAIAERKFLLVLDDVWSKSYDLWEILKSPFMVGGLGSKIIVTTRSIEVALTMGDNKYYNLKLLSDEDCWAIFEKHVSWSTAILMQQNLQLIRKSVVERCRGLPLVARTLGGLLRSKQTYDEWRDILNNKIWDLPEENGILSVLRLSYHNLPSHLKRCFVYCAIFPKDYEFEEKQVVSLWIAEGLIQQAKNKQLEDIGGEYFRDLLLSSIFQQSSNDDSKFIMHDLVNDLAQWISHETIFRLEDELSVMQIRRLERIRHSSYTFRKYEVEKNFSLFHKVKNLRTLLKILWPTRSIYDNKAYIVETIFFELLPKLNKLRSLSLTNYHVKKLPDSIGDLRHLRYLNLSETRITTLPESTSLLFNLQSLILQNCCCLMKFPSHIRNLINLRHFDIRGARLIKEMPWGMRKLKSLRTLSNFIVGNGVGSSLKDLKDLPFLCGELCISSLENATDSQESRDIILCDKNIEILMLEWCSDFDLSRDEIAEENVLDMLQPNINLKELTISNYGGKDFPSWIGDPSFSNIMVLKLDGCKNCTTLPSVGLLGLLKNLTIKNMSTLRKIGLETYGEGCSKHFQSLEILCFENLLEWEHWDPLEENEHVQRFPCLLELSISKCPKLFGRLPYNLPLLEKLVINECDQLVVSFTRLPVLHSLEINRCKGMVCSSPINSMTNRESKFPVFRRWSGEGFQKLESLKIAGCEELIHLWPNEICLEMPPKGSCSFTSLKELHMIELPNLVSFPEGFLSILNTVEITNCKAITSLNEGLKHNNARVEHLTVDGCPSLTFIVKGQLPSSLKTLGVENCENLMFIWEDDSFPSSSYSLMHKEDVDNTTTSLLYKLKIYNCPFLLRLSSTDHRLPKALTSLSLTYCPKLESIVGSFDTNTSLEYVLISKCENLKAIPEGLHTLCNLRFIWIDDCASLRSICNLPNTDLKVFISECEKLQALPSTMHTLKSLQHLALRECRSITFVPEQDIPTNLTSLVVEDPNIYKSLAGWGFHKLISLRTLTIGGSPDAVYFPEEEMGMKLPISLIQLTIRNFQKLEYLSPKGFQNLTSLEDLCIDDCPYLTSLPDLPSSLLQLHIYECPLLKQRCGRDEGELWSKISHIPCVEIYGKFIYE